MHCDEIRESLAAGEAAPSGHLEACPGCREAAGIYRLLRERLDLERKPASEALGLAVLAMARRAPRRRAWWPAAAAVLLLIGGFLLHGQGRKASPAPPLPAPPLPAPVPASYPRTLGGKDVEVAVLERGCHVEAAAGAVAEIRSGSEVALSRGRLYARTSRPLTIATPLGEFSATDAGFEILLSQEVAVSWLAPAWAGEGVQGELLVVEGQVIFRGLQVPAGSLLRISVEAPLQPERMEAEEIARRLAWRDGEASSQDLLADGMEAWTASGQGQARLEGGRLVLEAPGAASERVSRTPGLPARFLWSARVRVTKGGYLEVVLPAPVAGREVLTLGELPRLADGAEHLLALRWDLAPVLTLDGELLRRLERPSEDPAARPVGLGVMRGTLEVRSWQWKALP